MAGDEGQLEQPIAQLSVGRYLSGLADRSPVPGGGAAAALHVAQGAALVSMVGRFSDGPKYAPHAELIQESVRAASDLRQHALGLADRDAEAFAVVAAAYAAPKDTDSQKESRRHAIEQALGQAAQPPVAVVAAAGQVVRLAEQLIPVANRNLIADLAAAAEAARAGAATARVNIQVNASGISDPAAREELSAAAVSASEVVADAERVSGLVSKEITK